MIRFWLTKLRQVDPDYLTVADYELGVKLCKLLGLSPPENIMANDNSGYFKD